MENDVHLLEFPRLSITDRGFYHVKAINTEGEAKCSALINIIPQMILPEPMIVESNGRPPEFLQLFNDRKTTFGSNVTFEARLTGTQPLNVNFSLVCSSIELADLVLLFEVYWLFNGSPINRRGNNQRYHENISNDTYTLTIYNIRYEDVGRYTFNAENIWGKATCTAELLIPPTIARIGRISICEIHTHLIPSPRTLMLYFGSTVFRCSILFQSSTLSYTFAWIIYYLVCALALLLLGECSRITRLY